jgi:hypothetical protein
MNWKFSIPLSSAVLILAGCATYTESQRDSTQERRSGNVAGLAEKAKKNWESHKDDRDTVIFALEGGSAFRDLALANLPPPPVPVAPAGQEATNPLVDPFQQSIDFFRVADDKIDWYDEQAKHALSSGITTVVVNPGMTPYRGKAYDKIMSSTYQAIDFMALGDWEKARASFNKAYQRQADAVEENAKRIEMEKEKIEAVKNGQAKDEDGKTAPSNFDVDKAQNDPKAQAALDDVNLSLDARVKAYGDYVNPFTVFADALFMMTQASDAQEQERAASQFRRVAAMADQNAYLKDDAALAEKLAANATTLPKLTYVVFETGEAPHREEFKIVLPIILSSREVIMVDVPVSRLQFNDQYNENLQVTTDGQTLSTFTISSMDSVIASDFKRDLPSIWLDGLLSAATKAILNHEIQTAAQKNGGGLGASLMGLAANVYTVASSHADTRTWQSLPKTFAYARFATPAENTVTLSAGLQTKTVTLPADSTVNVVYVRQVQPATELLTNVIRLK